MSSLAYNFAKRWSARGAAIPILLFLSLSLSGCTVTFISSYDEVLDREVTALQKKVYTFLNELEDAIGTPQILHSNHRQFYSETKANIQAMLTRAQAIAKNDNTVAQIENLLGSIEDMEALHRMSLSSPDTPIPRFRDTFKAQFLSILMLNRAKKPTGGEEEAQQWH